ncbi:non-ribosomal peptide synthetase [Micromonospora sp. RP3T]|uniref:non-ribosomal peptide synthetase n=1 Tax=Micromonospora sp. RP3T TaxID=2135446 RepID=UPI001304ADF1|nr:non-ribosomal peptide synthetase [Micromonospora sp. RP3T]
MHEQPDFAHPILLPERIATQPETEEAVYPADPGAAPWRHGDLRDRAAAIAAVLRAVGVGRGDVVAILLPRVPDLVAGALAAWWVGACYLPVDPACPPQRLRFMLEDAAVAAVLTDPVAVPLAAELPDGVAVVDLTGVEPAPHPPARHRPHARDLAYVIYTSGSTGRPKGVAVEHGSLAGLTDAYLAATKLGPGERTSHLAGLAFDATVWETWPALAAGAALHLAPEPVRTDAPALLEWFAAIGITVAFVPTPVSERIMALPDPAELALRVLVTGGDRLRSRPLPGHPYAVWNAYGPTEATVAVTMGEVTPAGPLPPPVGHPLAEARLSLVDADGEPVGPGQVGELLVGGAPVARGYLNRPALTAAAFLPDPRPGVEGGRVYRTGDLMRRDEHGEYAFVGRADRQVQIRGNRVELSEVEVGMLRTPGVANAVAAVRPAASGEQVLIGYVVPAADADRDGLTDRVADVVRAELPAYMVPTSWLLVDSVPLTANGKVDVAALPLPDVGGAAPVDALEEFIAGVWASVLGVEPSRHDNFFDLGGHSLVAGQVTGRIGSAFDLDIPGRAMFDAQTVADLAELVRDRHPAPDELTEIARIHLMVDALSPDEVGELLSRQDSGTDATN